MDLDKREGIRTRGGLDKRVSWIRSDLQEGHCAGFRQGLGLSGIRACQSARSGRPEHDVSDIITFLPTRNTKREKDHANGFIETRATQQNKIPAKATNFYV